MANEEHLAMLRLILLSESSQVWDEWRKDNPQTIPDLEKASLKGLNLTGVNFSQTNLSSADLSNAKFKNSDLEYANLSKTNLINADLSGANLHFAQLNDACLTSANLDFANLKNADLQNVTGLTPEQLKFAINWQSAKFDIEFRCLLDNLYIRITTDYAIVVYLVYISISMLLLLVASWGWALIPEFKSWGWILPLFWLILLCSRWRASQRYVIRVDLLATICTIGFFQPLALVCNVFEYYEPLAAVIKVSYYFLNFVLIVLLVSGQSSK